MFDQLFGSGWDDPRSQVMMAISAGLLKKDLGGGLLAANDVFAQAKKAKVAEQLGLLQMENLRSEIDERKAGREQKAAGMKMLQGLLSASPEYAPGQLGSGTMDVMPNADPLSPTPARPGGLASATPEQIAMAKLYGHDLTEPWKVAVQGFERKPGSLVEFPGGRQKFIPDVKEGFDFQGGRKVMLPGHAEFLAQQTMATEGPKAQIAAKNDLVKVWNGEREILVPRSTVLGGQQPQAQPQPMPQPMQQPPTRGPAPQGMPQAQPGVNGNFQGDPTAIMQAIIDIKDPQERANAMAAFTEQSRRTPGFAQGGGFAAGPSASEAAAAAEAKARGEASGRLSAERDNEKGKRTDKARDMLSQLDRAEMYLQHGMPTASGIGALADKTGAFFGVNTRGAESASALENISGWLTSNVPRMEGPQSNFDVDNYKVMAGRVGDRTLPTEQRLAALKEVRAIQSKYAHLNADGGKTAEQPRKANVVQELPKTAQKGARARDLSTNQIMVFNGLSWVPEK